MNDAPLPNSPEARTPDGTLINQAVPPSSTPTPTPETKPDGQQVPAQTPEPKPIPPTAPETYAEFTAPEGTKLDADAIKSATPIFKELGLTQTQAQKLVETYTKMNLDSTTKLAQAYTDMRTGWSNQTKADPEIGSKLPEVIETVGRAFDTLGDPKLVASVKEALTVTGAGDHPAIIKAFYKMAQKIVEPKHVAGDQPSIHGQTAPGTNNRPSLAEAMYPNLARH